MWVIVGLGNPSEEYENTRHNVGRAMVSLFAKKEEGFSFEENTKIRVHIAKGEVVKEKVTLALPDTYMNKSGDVVKILVGSVKKAEKLVVIYDDLDLPLGTIKLSFGRGSGGHKGIESIVRAVGTKDFVRIRIGISAATPSGKTKKPKGEKKVLDFIMGTFSKREETELKKISKKINDALRVVILDGRQAAMNQFNSGAPIGAPTQRRRD